MRYYKWLILLVGIIALSIGKRCKAEEWRLEVKNPKIRKVIISDPLGERKVYWCLILEISNIFQKEISFNLFGIMHQNTHKYYSIIEPLLIEKVSKSTPFKKVFGYWEIEKIKSGKTVIVVFPFKCRLQNIKEFFIDVIGLSNIKSKNGIEVFEVKYSCKGDEFTDKSFTISEISHGWTIRKIY